MLCITICILKVYNLKIETLLDEKIEITLIKLCVCIRIGRDLRNHIQY